jgi:hypothetical protein
MLAVEAVTDSDILVSPPPSDGRVFENAQGNAYADDLRCFTDACIDNTVRSAAQCDVFSFCFRLLFCCCCLGAYTNLI